MSKKSDKILTLNDVYAIRRSGNPDKPFAPGVLSGELKDKSYVELVDIFDKRISNWYFDVAEQIQVNIKDYNFAVIIISSIIIDLLSQYIYAVSTSGESAFKRFFREYLKEYNQAIEPPIISCYFNKVRRKWLKENIRDVADGFYHCFRCGVVHSGGILEYGRISSRFSAEAVKIVQWQKNSQEININPIEFTRGLRCVFNDYIARLKKEDAALKKNFIEKFAMEYGIVSV